MQHIQLLLQKHINCKVWMPCVVINIWVLNFKKIKFVKWI